MANAKPKTRYILAVDGSHSTQGEIIKAISDGLGTGMVRIEPKESALLNKELSVCKATLCVVSNRNCLSFARSNANTTS